MKGSFHSATQFGSWFPNKISQIAFLDFVWGILSKIQISKFQVNYERNWRTLPRCERKFWSFDAIRKFFSSLYLHTYTHIYIYIYIRSICRQQLFRSLRAHQYSSDQNKILKGQSAQTSARVVRVALRLWLPFKINRVHIKLN